MIIIHCPKCTNVIAKGFETLVDSGIDFKFSCRCPHCQQDVIINVQIKTIRQASVVIDLRAGPVSPSSDSGPRVRVV